LSEEFISLLSSDDESLITTGLDAIIDLYIPFFEGLSYGLDLATNGELNGREDDVATPIFREGHRGSVLPYEIPLI